MERTARYNARQRGDAVEPWPRRPCKSDDPAYDASRVLRWRIRNPEKYAAQLERARHPAKLEQKQKATRRYNRQRGYRQRRRRRWSQRSGGRCQGPGQERVHCWHDRAGWLLLRAGVRIPQACCWCGHRRQVGMLEGLHHTREDVDHGKKAKEAARKRWGWPAAETTATEAAWEAAYQVPGKDQG